MEATIHYDNGNTYSTKAIFSDVNKKVLNHLQFTIKGKDYIIGINKLAENGIIRVTKNSNGKTLWSLSHDSGCAAIFKNLVFAFVISLVMISNVYPHPGRTDKNRGHFNKKTNKYHSHSKPITIAKGSDLKSEVKESTKSYKKPYEFGHDRNLTKRRKMVFRRLYNSVNNNNETLKSIMLTRNMLHDIIREEYPTYIENFIIFFYDLLISLKRLSA